MTQTHRQLPEAWQHYLRQHRNNRGERWYKMEHINELPEFFIKFSRIKDSRVVKTILLTVKVTFLKLRNFFSSKLTLSNLEMFFERPYWAHMCCESSLTIDIGWTKRVETELDNERNPVITFVKQFHAFVTRNELTVEILINIDSD